MTMVFSGLLYVTIEELVFDVPKLDKKPGYKLCLDDAQKHDSSRNNLLI